MKLNKSNLPEITDLLEPILIEDLESAIAEQIKVVNSLEDSPCSAARGDELFKLSKLHFRNQSFQLALDAAVQSVGFRRLFYGKGSKELLEAISLAQIITKELQKTNPPRRRRKKVMESLSSGATADA
ncbi:MAG TPA: hypothetical protein PKZ32_21215, partial [Candidatus Melainabacteria bacterium]|nr:hypothetical protein [Candidatus Melainabacteria bacterium]